LKKVWSIRVNTYEIDWRLSSTRQVLQALSDALKNVEKIILDETREDYEREDALQHAENLLGIAFVTAQTYIAGTVSDVNQFAKAVNNMTKDQLVKSHSEKIAEKPITKLELCDALANYYKHHDEWESWSAIGRQQKTVATLQAAGIKESDSYPCIKAAEMLWLNTQSLESLLSLISNWREAIIMAYKN
jgi:hypothetical protein